MSCTTTRGEDFTEGRASAISGREANERAAPGPSNKGREAAEAALEMARLFAKIGDARDR